MQPEKTIFEQQKRKVVQRLNLELYILEEWFFSSKSMAAMRQYLPIRNVKKILLEEFLSKYNLTKKSNSSKIEMSV